MSELVVFKANELAVSRYDLTEHETKLILCCVSLLNPTLNSPSRADRTVTFTYQQYAKMMNLSLDNAYHRLNKATSELMKRTVEIIYPTGDTEKTIFQWVNFARFSRKNQSLELVFSEDILPYLFQLKKFIKYNLEHVKSFENKYSMRVYEWLLKELTQRKTHKANIEISIEDFKFMLMLESKYKDLRDFNKKILNLVSRDLNSHSNMKIEILKLGRPADTLIFQCELSPKVKLEERTPINSNVGNVPKSIEPTLDQLHDSLKRTLHNALTAKTQLSSFEAKFLSDMQSKYDLNGSFNWLSEKQRNTLINILTKHGHLR